MLYFMRMCQTKSCKPPKTFTVAAAMTISDSQWVNQNIILKYFWKLLIIQFHALSVLSARSMITLVHLRKMSLTWLDSFEMN